jgi:hypothetical protein
MFNRIEWCREGALLRVYPRPGERVPMTGNASECMMHMRLTDKPIDSVLTCHEVPESLGRRRFYGARVYPEPNLAPMHPGIGVTPGEAGFYYDDAEGTTAIPTRGASTVVSCSHRDSRLAPLSR